MAAELEKLVAVAAKTEATRLLDAAPTWSANGIRITGAAPQPRVGYLETNPRDDAQTGTLEAEGRAPSAGRFATISIPCELHGLGAAYGATPNVIDQDPLIRALAFARAASGVAPADQVDYSGADLAASCTIYAWTYGGPSYGAKLYRLTGCVGTAAIALRANKVATVTYEMTGVLATDPAEAAITGTPPAMPSGPVFTSATTSLGGFTFGAGLNLLEADITIGNTVTAMPSAGASDGHNGYEITARASTARLRLFSVSLAAYNAFAKSRSGSDPLTLSWGLGGPTYNGITISAPAFEAGAPDVGSEGGIGVITLDGALKKSGATRALTVSTR